MSGGVGPCKDIGLMKDETEPSPPPPPSSSSEEEESKDLMKKKNNKLTSTITGHHRFFSFRQLNALVVIVVLSTSGTVALEDFAFLIFSIIYILFLSKFIFPRTSTTPSPDPPLMEKTTIQNLYVFTGILVGLLFPIAYIFEGIVEGDKEGIKAASPHVFLLSCQIFLEGVVYNSVDFSLPIKVFVSVVYNGRMLVAAMDWLLQEVLMDGGGHGTKRRLHVGRLLALVNLVYWSFNLFGFLVPVYLPRAFRAYYGQKEKLML